MGQTKRYTPTIIELIIGELCVCLRVCWSVRVAVIHIWVDATRNLCHNRHRCARLHPHYSPTWCVWGSEGGGRGGGGEPSCCISSSPRVPTLLFSARLSLFYRSHHMLWLAGPFRGCLWRWGPTTRHYQIPPSFSSLPPSYPMQIREPNYQKLAAKTISSDSSPLFLNHVPSNVPLAINNRTFILKINVGSPWPIGLKIILSHISTEFAPYNQRRV